MHSYCGSALNCVVGTVVVVLKMTKRKIEINICSNAAGDQNRILIPFNANFQRFIPIARPNKSIITAIVKSCITTRGAATEPCANNSKRNAGELKCKRIFNAGRGDSSFANIFAQQFCASIVLFRRRSKVNRWTQDEGRARGWKTRENNWTEKKQRKQAEQAKLFERWNRLTNNNRM